MELIQILAIVFGIMLFSRLLSYIVAANISKQTGNSLADIKISDPCPPHAWKDNRGNGSVYKCDKCGQLYPDISNVR